MTEIDDIICAINPDRFSEATSSDLKEFKKIIKNQGLDEGLKQMKDLGIKPKPSVSHKLVYDSMAEQLEPVYFWILDFMNDMFQGNVEKLMDNFASSAGSGHFGEMGIRKSEMQKQASQLLTTMNQILKSVIQLLYDLKEFQIRLTHYDNAKSENAITKESANLALKQIWMDKVDMQRGIGSINQMSSGQLQFVTLRNAFLKINTPEEVDELDLNDIVKRVLKPRIQEYIIWKEISEKELRKRFEIEKTYLKSQVDSLKLQAKWAKPYLKAAEQLETRGNLGKDSALVSAFNVLMLELTLLAQSKINIKDAVLAKDLPHDFINMEKKLRTYKTVVLVDFKFRGVPSKSGQHYTFGGRSEVEFKAYALNDDEIDLLRHKLDDSDLNSSLKLIKGMTDESLGQLKIDLEEFLDKEDEKKEEKKEDSNPFSALFDFLRPSKKSKKSKEGEDEKEIKLKQLKEKGIKSDNYAEQYLRNMAEAEAINNCYAIFDIYKKAHGMASLPYMEDLETKPPRTKTEEVFGFGKENY